MDMPKAYPEAVSRLHIPDASELDDSIRPIIEENIRQKGYVENWIIAMAVNPGTLARAAAYFQSLFDPRHGKISAAERELIAMVVSGENGCAYCEIHHTKGLAQALDDPLRARRIALGYDHVPDLTPRERALADLAVKITRDPHSVSDADIDGLRQLGLDDSAILEAIETAAFFNYTNRVAIPMGNVPENQLFDF